MILNELMEDLKKLRNEMVAKNWPAQRLSDIIVVYEDKIIQHNLNEAKKERDILFQLAEKDLNAKKFDE